LVLVLLWLTAGSALAAGGRPTTVVVVDFAPLQVMRQYRTLGVEVAQALSWKLQALKNLDTVFRWEMARKVKADFFTTPPGVDSQRARNVGRKVGTRWVVSGNFTAVGDQLQLRALVVDVLSGQAREKGLILVTSPKNYLQDLDKLVDKLAPIFGQALGEQELASLASVPTASQAALGFYARALADSPELAPSKADRLLRGLEAALSADSRFTAAVLAKAYVLSEQGKTDEAISTLQEVLKARPEFAPGWWYLHYLEQAAGETRLAAQALEKALELEPRNPRFVCTEAEDLIAAHNPRQASRKLRELLVALPENAEAHLIAAKAALAQGAYSNAISEYKQTLGLPGASEYEIYSKLAEAYALDGKVEEALTAWDQAAAKAPNEPWPLVQKGALLLAHQRYQEALETLQLALAVKPDYYWTRLNLARTYAALGNAKAAENQFLKAEKLAKKPVEAKFYHAFWLFQQGKYAEAVSLYEEVLQLVPDHQATLFNLALCEHKLHEDAKARALLERFLKLKPPPAWQQRANQLLAKLQPPAPVQTGQK